MDMQIDLMPRLTILYGKLLKHRGLSTKAALVDDVAGELFRLYNQEHRHYHTLAHIHKCLREFDEVAALCSNDLAAEMALWYHDAVYETSWSDGVNERISANKALFDCIRLGVSDLSFQEAVVRNIMATRHVLQYSGDEALVADIDLSVLGSTWEKFIEYERQIRQEYRHVPDNDFLTRRSLVLDGFLRRPRIYQTEHFYNKYEKTARANIALSLARMRASNA